MKVSIQTLGGLGDVMPFLSVAGELATSGADVSILAPRDFEPLIVGRGVTAASPPGFSLSEWMAEAGRRGTLDGPYPFFRDWSGMIQPHVDDVMERCLEAAADADIVLANTVCAPARLAAAYHDKPFVLNAHQPVISPTADIPCAMVWKPWMGRAFTRQTYAAVSLAYRFMDAALSGHRKRLGLSGYPALGDNREHLGRPFWKLTSVNPALLPFPPSDWTPADVLTPYPSLAPSETDLPEDLQAFLKSGPPPIYIGYGSMELDGKPPPANAIVEALAATGQRAILSAGLGAYLDSASEDIFLTGNVPHDRLFPHCAAVLHHGGAGTLDTALRAGMPQIIAPHYLDQFWHVHRLQQLGVAPPPLRPHHFTAAGFADAIRFVLSDTVRSAAVRLRDSVRGTDGASDIARRVIAEARAWR